MQDGLAWNGMTVVSSATMSPYTLRWKFRPMLLSDMPGATSGMRVSSPGD